MSESSVVMGVLPEGTITLVLGDVEGSTRLWETSPEDMRPAVRALDDALDDVMCRHGGHRPVEQGEGDSFVVAFGRAADAVNFALEVQAAVIYPLRLRIGIHTGDVELRDEGNYAGPAINRCARLRDSAHGGQTVLSQTTHDIVVDRLPEGTTLLDLGVHRFRDLSRPERVFQLGDGAFPPLRSLDAYTNNLPVQLTSFIGRERELAELRALLAEHRLMTLTGAGGSGKTRLALQLASEVVERYADGVFAVDLSRIQDDSVVATSIAQAIGLLENRETPVEDAVVERLSVRSSLVILDNCEHVLDATARVTERLLRSCAAVTVLATSREPLGVAGEAIWRVPSMSLPTTQGGASEAIDLFVDRAHKTTGSFTLADENRGPVTEICRRLDGLPLAIELAAARVRVMDVGRIAAGLHDRFRLLSGGSRTSVQRQQTLRASIDWSHDLLTEPDRILFRRLAVFVGSFDLDAAEAVGCGDGLAAHQVLDQLASLVDKSLVLIEDSGRYRMLETVRQYGLDKLAEASEPDDVRRAHRDHYLSLATAFRDQVRTPALEEWIARFMSEVDNLRAACDWSRDIGDRASALRLVLPLVWVWRNGYAYRDSFEWFDEVLSEAPHCPPDVRIDALMGWLRWNAGQFGPDAAAERAAELIELARASGDTAVLARALYGAGYSVVWNDPTRAVPFYEEAIVLARASGDHWTIADAGGYLVYAKILLGTAPSEIEPLLDEALGAARQADHRFRENMIAILGVMFHTMAGDLHDARDALWRAVAQVEDRDDRLMRETLSAGSWCLALLGDVDNALALSADPPDVRHWQHESFAFVDYQRVQARGIALLAAGRLDEARLAFAAGDGPSGRIGMALIYWQFAVSAHLAAGDVEAARACLDRIRARINGPDQPWLQAAADLYEAKLLAAESDGRAEATAHVALRELVTVGDKLGTADALELLAMLACEDESHAEGARLLAAAASLRDRIGNVPFPHVAAANEALRAQLREALGDEFDEIWNEGASLSCDDAVAYAQRGRGERKRPSSGWASLTPAELDVVRLVGDGMTNKEIAAKLFISPRTVQAHLTHVYAKVGVSSRMQLAKGAASHSTD